MGINKVQYGNTVLIDLTDTTAVASDVAQGKYFYGKDGVKTLGTGSGGGGSVTQDQDGYIVLPSTGGGGDITVEALSVTQNGTYTAQTGHAYSPVTVNVSGVQESTGTVNGSGGTTLQISCSFAPNLIYIYGDMSGSVSNRGIVSVTILKDSEIIITNDGSTSSSNETLFHYNHSITDYGIVSEPHATYSNGVLTIDVITDLSSSRFNSSITYSYKLVGWS